MSKLLAMLGLALALALATPTSAQQCVGTTTTPEVNLSLYYIDLDACGGNPCVFVYRESNGVPGLQRGDSVKDDTCGGLAYASDTHELA